MNERLAIEVVNKSVLGEGVGVQGICAVILFAGFPTASQTVGMEIQWSCVLSLGF